MAFSNDQGGQGSGFQPKKRYEGNWTCGMCGGAITSLPFEPKKDQPDALKRLKCLDCYKKSRPPRDNRF